MRKLMLVNIGGAPKGRGEGEGERSILSLSFPTPASPCSFDMSHISKYFAYRHAKKMASKLAKLIVNRYKIDLAFFKKLSRYEGI